ncbi:unnamed protein product [Notodromas monacha]|uniref:Uncharacterized protein n=1 Tax=Notodromas monacha TaxID=399045 RepID=A0A7R9GKG1_9CRUS|nr:unnamed protein product [Notodromas monacha]CAD7284550.1 unnamed protein product [Notodromas monacha]CAG0920104.1 unnamed protein product [Notodromas monacha]CAG0924702.1 unnamed protein product [Notodromas monacha]
MLFLQIFQFWLLSLCVSSFPTGQSEIDQNMIIGVVANPAQGGPAEQWPESRKLADKAQKGEILAQQFEPSASQKFKHNRFVAIPKNLDKDPNTGFSDQEQFGNAGLTPSKDEVFADEVNPKPPTLLKSPDHFPHQAQPGCQTPHHPARNQPEPAHPHVKQAIIEVHAGGAGSAVHQPHHPMPAHPHPMPAHPHPMPAHPHPMPAHPHPAPAHPHPAPGHPGMDRGPPHPMPGHGHPHPQHAGGAGLHIKQARIEITKPLAGNQQCVSPTTTRAPEVCHETNTPPTEPPTDVHVPAPPMHVALPRVQETCTVPTTCAPPPPPPPAPITRAHPVCAHMVAGGERHHENPDVPPAIHNDQHLKNADVQVQVMQPLRDYPQEPHVDLPKITDLLQTINTQEQELRKADLIKWPQF